MALVLVGKLILSYIFSSDYVELLFKPFIEVFLQGKNPYQYYWQHQLVPSFPYPPLMLFIQAIPCGLMGLLGIENPEVQTLFFKLPSFLMDCAILQYFVRLYPQHKRYAGMVYFSSPMILYAVYMHGQLDLIPIGFLFLSLGYLTQPEDSHKIRLLSALLFGFALSSKTMVLIALPLVALYLFRRKNLASTVLYCVEALAVFFCINLPFISQGLIQTVYLNNEQNKLLDLFINMGSLKIFIPIVAIQVMYLHILSLGNISRNLLFCLVGVLFAICILLTKAMPAWYVWIVPFATYYMISGKMQRHKNVYIFAMLSIAYLLFFLFGHQSDYVDLSFMGQALLPISAPPLVVNVLLSFLSAVLLYFVLTMYQFGVRSNTFYHRSSLPFSIAISGDSGTGKSELLAKISSLFGEENIVHIEGDGDHKWERGDKNWSEYTHLNPKANYVYRQAKDLEELHNGNAVSRVDYDHDTGRFTQAYKIQPKKYLVLSSLHALYLPQMRKNIDLKIYMDTDESLRRLWKIQRDTAQRGYSIDQILQQIESRMQDAREYIYPQKEFADVVIRYFTPQTEEKSFAQLLNEDIFLSMSVSVDSAVNFDLLLEILHQHGVLVDQSFSPDLKRQTIVFCGESLQNCVLPFDQIAHEVIPHLEDIKYRQLQGATPLDSLQRLLILMLISEKMRGTIS